jgi:CheY-like chemotaxis protein
MQVERTATGHERRKRLRAKLDLSVRIEGGRGTLQVFEDLGKTIDVSRDGLLVSTPRSGYWVGQLLQVTCPYWGTPAAINTARRAKVIRSVLLPNFNNAVALQFEGNGIDAPGGWTSTPFAHHVRVLAVDSDARMAHAASVLLSQDGYHVLFVSTAQQALDILKNETPDVIVAEAEGGEISGHDLCAIVKTSERLQHIPVILMTASALPSDYATGRRLGAVVCMMKPCKPAQLRQAVHLVAPPPSQQSVYSAAFNMGSFVRTC